MTKGRNFDADSTTRFQNGAIALKLVELTVNFGFYQLLGPRLKRAAALKRDG